MTENINILSWNIKGLNNKDKRKEVFHYLRKQRYEIITLQETHIRSRDKRLLRNKKLGKEYISATKQKKKGVVVYINEKLPSKELFNDENGHYIGIEVGIDNKKVLLVSIYAPLEKKANFFCKIKDILLDYNDYEFILCGDWNAVIDPQNDRLSPSLIKINQGKLPKSFFQMMQNFILIDVWRFKYGEQKQFTFYSERHKSYSRIDMFLCSKTLCSKIMKLDSLPRIYSDHNPILLTIKKRESEYRWYFPDYLMKNPEIVKEAKKNHPTVFPRKFK